MTKKDAINLLERAAWTFAQAFIGAWLVFGYQINKVALVAAVGAGLSAVKTFVTTSFNSIGQK